MKRTFCLPNDSVFGRGAEIEMGAASLVKAPAHSILTLTGPPGSGKTRLALEIASRLATTYDEVYFVSITDLASAEDLDESLGRGPAILSNKAKGCPAQKSLYVLDQFDTLRRPGVAALEEAIKNEARKFLLTSRHPIGIANECVTQVLSLNSADSRQMFIARSSAKASDAWESDASAKDIEHVCSLLGGLPLGLEIVSGVASAIGLRAARTNLEGFMQAVSNSQKGPLDAAFELALDSLPFEHRALLIRLSVFQNEFTVESANSICSSSKAEPLLRELRDRHFLFEDQGLGRYRLRDSLREFLWNRLSGRERAPLRTNHAYCFARLAAAWPAGADLEHANFATALQWCVETENVEMGFCLAHALRKHWATVGATGEARRWLKRLLSIPDSTVPALVTERANAALTGSGPAE